MSLLGANMHFQNVTLETKDPTTTCSRQEKKIILKNQRASIYTNRAVGVRGNMENRERERGFCVRKQVALKTAGLERSSQIIMQQVYL